MIDKIAIKLILSYKRFISPILVLYFGHGCKFSPTCSEYAAYSIRKHGLYKGTWLSFKRFIACNPFSDRIYHSPTN